VRQSRQYDLAEQLGSAIRISREPFPTSARPRVPLVDPLQRGILRVPEPGMLHLQGHCCRTGANRTTHVQKFAHICRANRDAVSQNNFIFRISIKRD
jgi:hypothetical protein